ncbi:GNAT family N-acetyltransferase [Acidicapsa acidisoli]|uniref:GNAT family N-acetyltransferase n=1 Tax=Acidicapsa acidisoli TaxID=1615681 RepID=UPI0021DFCAC5|nr:GNAT family N-acetyltransferase [Acidicapsa acidisoli]
MPYQIRPAQSNDARAIAHVHLESWKTTYPGIIPEAYIASLKVGDGEQRWQQQLESETNDIFVSHDESGIFGFISGGPIREPIGNYDGELYAIYLLQQRQQQGAGRALVRTLADSLHARGLKSMIVWALEANSAVDFYKHLGAVPVTSKNINIGGKDLPDTCLGWPSLHPLL